MKTRELRDLVIALCGEFRGSREVKARWVRVARFGVGILSLVLEDGWRWLELGRVLKEVEEVYGGSEEEKEVEG